MYFETNQVNKALLCKLCEEFFENSEPKILPCGETICSFCVSSIQVTDNLFDCLLCQDKHEMPKNGLPNNKALIEILSVKQVQVSRGKSFDLLIKLVDKILEKRNFIRQCIDNSTDLVKDYCMDMRTDVQLATEEVIQQINDLSMKIIEEVDEYEKELIENNRNNSKSFDEFNKFVKELESFHAVNNEYLKQHLVDDEIINKSNEEASNLIQKSEKEIQTLKDIIFDERFFKFEKSSQKIMKSILGTTFFHFKRKNDSVILSDKNQVSDLMHLCEFPADQKWTLIYRASLDGFKSTDFHSRCDKRINTLIIIKSTNGNVFGGYTEQTWSGIGFKADSSSFIFSLINKLNEPKKIKWSKNEGIYCHSSFGPTFGGINHDLCITDCSNTDKSSYSNLGHSYTHSSYTYGSNEAKSFLADSHQFQVTEIEAYTKK